MVVRALGLLSLGLMLTTCGGRGCQSSPSSTDQSSAFLLDQITEASLLAGGVHVPPAETLHFQLDADTPISMKLGMQRKDAEVIMMVRGRTEPAVVQVPVDGGRAYRFEGRVRTEGLVTRGPSVGASYELYEMDAAGKVTMRHNHMQRLRGTQDWTVIETMFTTQRDTVEIHLRLHPGGIMAMGKVHFDQVKFLRVPPGVEVFKRPKWGSTGLVHQVELRKDTRPALVVESGTEVAFDHQVVGPATLRFAVGRPGRISGKVCVRVMQGDKELTESCVSKARWRDVDLAIDGEQPLRFELKTSGDTSFGFLADPSVIPRGLRPGPNVVVISVDTLRPDALGIYGAERASPALQRLASQGIVYDRAWSASGWTAPSLASLVSSTLPAHHGAGSRVLREVSQTRESTSQFRKNQLNYRGMRATELTLISEVFRGAGYETVGFYANHFFSDALGFARGFSRYQQFKGYTTRGAAKGVELFREWVKSREGEGPFLASLHFVDPHTPYHLRRDVTPDLWPPDPVIPGLVRDDDAGVATFKRFRSKTRKHYREVRPFYESEVAYLDQQLAELFQVLEGLDNTMIVVLSDHGEGFKEHGLLVHGNSLYEELVRIPLIVRLPDGSRAGTRVDTPVSILDVAPTVVRQAGLEVPEGWKGVDLLAPEENRTIMMEGVYTGADQYAVVRWPHKLIWRPADRHHGYAVDKKPQLKLFDLSADPGEKKNLQKTRPEVASRLLHELRQYVAKSEGWHLRCAPGEEERTIILIATVQIGQVANYSLEKDDISDISFDHRRLKLTIRKSQDNDKLDGLAIRTRGMGGEVSAEGVEVVAGPTPPPAGKCVLWHNVLAAEDLGSKVGKDGMEELRVLGYVE